MKALIWLNVRSNLLNAADANKAGLWACPMLFMAWASCRYGAEVGEEAIQRVSYILYFN